jgi:hypothetical protein
VVRESFSGYVDRMETTTFACYAFSSGKGGALAEGNRQGLGKRPQALT